MLSGWLRCLVKLRFGTTPLKMEILFHDPHRRPITNLKLRGERLGHDVFDLVYEERSQISISKMWLRWRQPNFDA